MMRQELNSEIYVRNEEKLVYRLYATELHETTMYLHLELVAGWDYINPDLNDVQGWVAADRFTEEVQSEHLVCYILNESIKECLWANDFEVIKGNPLELQEDK